jgi:hypothetical protein
LDLSSYYLFNKFGFSTIPINSTNLFEFKQIIKELKPSRTKFNLLNFPHLFFYLQIIFRLHSINDEIVQFYEYSQQSDNPQNSFIFYRLKSSDSFIINFFSFFNLILFQEPFYLKLIKFFQLSMNKSIFSFLFTFQNHTEISFVIQSISEQEEIRIKFIKFLEKTSKEFQSPILVYFKQEFFHVLTSSKSENLNLSLIKEILNWVTKHQDFNSFLKGLLNEDKLDFTNIDQ